MVRMYSRHNFKENIPRIKLEDFGVILEKNFVPKVPHISQSEYDNLKNPKLKDFIELIKRNQPAGWDPADPPLKMAGNFHYFLYESLKDKKLIDDDISKVKLYTARGSILDYSYSTDFFVEYFDKELNRNVFMTVDLKAVADESKVGGELKNSSADLVLNMDPDLLADIEENSGEIEDVLQKKAKELADLFAARKNELSGSRKMQESKKV